MNSVSGWRGHYDSFPYVALGVALGSGLLLGALLAGPGTRSSSAARWPPKLLGRAPSDRHQILRDWINIALATFRMAETLRRVAPLVRDQFAGVGRSRRAGLLG